MNSPDFKPFMYQDLLSGSNSLLPPLGMPLITGMYPTNFLGTVRLQPQSDSDKFLRMQEKDASERNAFLTSLAVLGVIGASTALLFKGKINFKGFWNAIASPFKSKGNVVKSGSSVTGNVISPAGKKSKSSLKSLGSILTAPFKLIGKGLKQVGKAIVYPFKSIKSGLGKLFKRKPKSEHVQIKGVLEPPKNIGGTTPNANSASEVLSPDKIIMTDGTVLQ